jgi:hypothetical protein
MTRINAGVEPRELHRRHSELKPCPFCGLSPKLLDAGGGVVFVACPPGPCSGSLEEAAKVADDVQESEREEKRFDKEGGDYDPYSYGAGFSDGSITTSVNIGTAIRALSPPVKDTTK